MQSTIHQPLYTKVANYLNNQRRTGEYCDIILELENNDISLRGHFSVIAAQSVFVQDRLNSSPKTFQFSIQNPLKIIIKNFNCVDCLQTMVNFFYQDVISITNEHEAHFKHLAQILAVTELLSLFGLLKGTEHQVVEEQYMQNVESLNELENETETTTNIFDKQKNYFNLKNPKATGGGKVNYCIGCDFKCYPVQQMLNHIPDCEPAHLTCSLCEVGFLDYFVYMAHLKKHSADTKKPFFCIECDVRFQTRAALLAHKPKHSQETPHLCSECGKGFKWKHNLVCHMLIHTKEKLMLCDVCGYSTYHMKALKAHKLQHTGEFFKCSFPNCNHRANRKENLKIHMETHKQEKPFVCEICGCGFSQNKNLKRHALRHTEHLQKYRCQLCSFSSYRSDKVKEHTQRVHTEKAVQLELSETVESALEHKEDEYNFPI